MIAAMLAERGIVLRRYEPGEHRAPCPWCARGKRDDALAVRIDQDGATWLCHRCGETGGVRLKSCDGTPWRRHRAHTQELPPEPETEQHLTLSPWGLDLWEATKRIRTNTVAAAYLGNRFCRIPPGDLRWHPALEDKVSGYTGPALIGLVTDASTGEPINLHRTWLAPDGSGKAPIDKPRRLLKGHRSIGVIRLWPDTEVTTGLVVGEGIETCLAAAKAGLGPVWATISANGMAQFPALPGIEGLTILVDHDKPNPKTGKRAGHEAALALIDRYEAAGFNPERDIRCILSEREGEDIADLAKDGEL